MNSWQNSEVDQWTSFIYWEDAFINSRTSPYHEVPIFPATEENLKDFGKLVYDFDAEPVERVTWPKTNGWRKLMEDSGNKQALIEGDYVIKWKENFVHSDNLAAVFVKNDLITGISAADGIEGRKLIFARDATYHPDGSQVFFPRSNRPYVLLLAPPVGDDIQLEDFKAFWFDGSFGFNVAPGVWHQSPYCLDDVTAYANKQSSVFGIVKVDTVKEFGKFLRVPLVL